MKALIALAGLGVAVVVFSKLGAAEPEWKEISTYATTVGNRTEDQRHNALLSMKKLDGVVIEPGETISFNDVVGVWSRDQGYRRAPVSFGGSLIKAWGGGVCQTSTTLYNAALVGGLEVVERHSHHHAPIYVSPGRDAAVAFPNIDLKLRNPHDFPIRISARMDREMLFVQLEGWGSTVAPASIEQRFVKSYRPSDLAFGSGRHARVRSAGKPGAVVETYRVIGDRTEMISSDNYPVRNRVVEYMRSEDISPDSV